jgi:hypothetical protein
VLTLTMACIFLAGGTAPTGFSCCQVWLNGNQQKQRNTAAPSTAQYGSSSRSSLLTNTTMIAVLLPLVM